MTSPADYVRGGMALERLWITAEMHGLAVHPVSPVFLHAHSEEDLRGLSEPLADVLRALQQQLGGTVGLGDADVPVLVLRLSSDAPPAAVRSQRLDRDKVLTPSAALPAATQSGTRT